jgi:hypothetical protein
MYAHYFATKIRKYLIITNTPACTHEGRLMEIEVEGKADARKRAAFYGAKPWNF